MINLYANMTGLWKKIAGWLPLIIGLGTLLSGISGLLLELGHAANVTAILNIFKNLQSDSNTALIIAGLGALGIHTNHASTTAVLADHQAQILNANPGNKQ
jgi:hypothetical protein